VIALALGLVLQIASMRTIDQGPTSAIDSPREVVVRTAAEWQALWREHAPERQAPEVDFSRSMVVGVFLGSRPSAGYGVTIQEPEQAGDGLVVRYRESRPAPGAMTAQIMTAPFQLVAVPRAATVRFEKAAAPR
jgi:hypothetical protein